MGKAQENEAKRGKGVTQEAQDVFDAFSRTMPTRWDGSNIIVADAVSITAPYRVDDCRPLVAGDVAALNHVRKVVCSLLAILWSIFSNTNHMIVQLEMERKKIELRNASASIGKPGTHNNASQRKGG